MGKSLIQRLFYLIESRTIHRIEVKDDLFQERICGTMTLAKHSEVRSDMPFVSRRKPIDKERAVDLGLSADCHRRGRYAGRGGWSLRCYRSRCWVYCLSSGQYHLDFLR